ncbi:MAG: hypothetical protein R3C11_09770 [Planctomycetaceae bacterium]
MVTLPLLVLTLVALYWAQPARRNMPALQFGAWGLLLSSAVFFILNFAFLGFPWNWLQQWQLQTNSGMIYDIAWVVLSGAAIWMLARYKGTDTTLE